jgi:exodeoxyribonuclease VII small subunit
MSPPPPAAAAGEPQTYESALARVEQIIRRLDGGQAGLRETLELVGEGRTLIEFCARELEAVGRGLEELRLDELVARLEATPAAAPREATPAAAPREATP